MSDSVWAAGSEVQAVVRAADPVTYSFTSESGPSYILPTTFFPSGDDLIVDIDGLLQTKDVNFGYVKAERRLTFTEALPAGLTVHVKVLGTGVAVLPEQIVDPTPFGNTLISQADAAGARSTLGLGNSATRNVGVGSTQVAQGDHAHAGLYAAASHSHDLTTDDATGILPVSKGGTGTETPGLVAGSNVAISGTWPNHTVSVSGQQPGISWFDEGALLGTAGTATAVNFTGAITASRTANTIDISVTPGAFDGNVNSNLNMIGTARKITGDFSNATLANKTAFQTSTLNGPTQIPVYPNGTSQVAGMFFYNTTDPLNAQRGVFQLGTSALQIISNYTGTPGAALPIEFNIAGTVVQKMLQSGEVGIGVTPGGGMGTLQVQNVNGAAASGFRNKIINGCMRISKKGNGAAALESNYLGADGVITFIGGWSALSGANISRDLLYANDGRATTGAIHYLALGTPTGASGYVIFQDRIEARDTCELGGKYVTASCRVTPWATAVTNHYFRIYKANAADNFGAQTLVSQSGNLGAIAINQIMQASYTFQLPAAEAVTGLQVELVVEYSGAIAASSYLFLGDFQFCEGSKAMPFELRPIAIEEQLRSRYYRKQDVHVGITNARTCFPIDMRIAPTVTGGGAGFTNAGSTADTLICYQTTAAVHTLTLSAEL